MHPFVETVSVVGGFAVAMVAAIVVLTLFYKVLALEVPRTQFLTGGHDNSLTEQDSMESRSILTSSLSLPSSRSLRSPPRAIVHSFFTCTIVSLLCLSQQDAWGVEALRNQLLHAKTISLQGTELIYNEHRPDDAPVRVPIELSIERPNKFRFQYSIVSNGDGPPEISNALLLCDGHIETNVDTTEKTYSRRALGELDARLQTETYAQGHCLNLLLGPAGSNYHKIGSETVENRECDIYEAHATADSGTTITKLWLDRTSGYPQRLERDEIPAGLNRRRVCELRKFSINIDLPDQHFQFPSPKDFQDQSEPQPDNVPALSIRPVVGGRVSKVEWNSATTTEKVTWSSLECWYTLLVTDNTAIVIWRRSAPESEANRSLDWLSEIEIYLSGSANHHQLRHQWLYQSTSAVRWNWSLVAAPHGQSLLGNRFTFALHNRVALEPATLQLTEDFLQQVLTTAARETTPKEALQPLLAELRRNVESLSQRK